MAKKSGKTRPDDIELLQDEPIEAGMAKTAPMTSRKTISKAAAARAALAEGIVVPKKASLYIKEKHGIDISPQQFSAEKSRLKHRSGSADVPMIPSPSANRRESSHLSQNGKLSGDASLLNALEVMKPLIDQLGVEKVKRMVELLG